MLTLADLLQALTGLRPASAGRVLTDAVLDSRQAIPGCLFLALEGEHVDGHDYVSQAFANGADVALISHPVEGHHMTLDLRGGKTVEGPFTYPLCVLVDDGLKALQDVAAFWRRQLPDLRVIGITGSVGKSTTKEIVAEVIGQQYTTLKNAGNFNNEIGLPLTVLRLTPGHQRAVLEMGFYVAGEIELLCGIAQPVVGVVTNIGTVHAERAGSQEAIAAGKAELVQALPKDGWALLNYDDPMVRAMASQTQAQVLYYGLNSEADLWADEVEGLGLDGIRFRLHYQGDSYHLRIPMIGRHSVHTALRAAAVGITEGLSWPEIIEGLGFGHTQLRLMAVRAEGGALLLDDTYNASPKSTLAALNLLEELDGRKVAVLGDMLELGPYEKEGHYKIGLRAAEVADEILTIGPRARDIARAAREAGKKVEEVTELENADQAVGILRTRLHPQDVVLVKGSRGVHMDNIVPELEAVR
ncbi:MAG: UDP-N-acetylmuramoyl-tripeptide--D-alanyl-D-alanine ligase [Chloroflexi bacterium]|nr:MAG: UDP-N-acetylmuramoyl-tripeptide--D-alanyl-D-alanine ligase [Chloroflexota bacterium]MBL1196734.1 UDP-N-acetylmuramoyl-tripeptide--D-alanyl-D-alanine ligase [Chloroflexota bacterium]NOH14028.1 UDP-N-acetylmuramoyl-tripeptide--D-alanyl-D-alanine ligase [Chloroflexota bacterium]